MDKSTQNNQPNPSPVNDDKYQDILDQYAASVKPETEEKKEPDNQDPQPFLKEVEDLTAEVSKLSPVVENNPPAVTPTQTLSPVDPVPSFPAKVAPAEPIIPPQNPPTPNSVDPIDPVDSPLINPSLSHNIEDEEPAITENPIEKTTIEPSQKSPEEIKQQVEEILNTPSSPQADNSSTNNFPKILFILALIIFLGVAGLLTYAFFTQPKQIDNKVTSVPTPTEIAAETVCTLGDRQFKSGESFLSEDGCNTCTCQSKDVIACTEKACSTTPSATISPVPTASSSSSSSKITVKPTKSL